jgi:tetratricopeptide (TPR) repeat protein
MSILFKAVERAKKAHDALGRMSNSGSLNEYEDNAPYSYDENDFYEGPVFANGSGIESEYEDDISYKSSYSTDDEVEGSFSNFLMFVMSLGILTAMIIVTVGAFIFKDDITKQFSNVGSAVASKETETDNYTNVARNSANKTYGYADNQASFEPGFGNNKKYENLFARKAININNQKADVTPVNVARVQSAHPVTVYSENPAYPIQQASTGYAPQMYQVASSNMNGRVMPPISQNMNTPRTFSSASANELSANSKERGFYMKMDNVPHVIPKIKPVDKIAQTANQQLAQASSIEIRDHVPMSERKIAFQGRQTYQAKEEIHPDPTYAQKYSDNPDFIQLAKADGLGHIPVSNLRIEKARLVERPDASTNKSINIYRESEEGKSDKYVKVTTFSPNSKTDLNKGYNSLVNGDYKAAVASYDKVLAKETTNTYALLGKASALHKMGKKLEARLEYETILQRDPTNREALSNLLGLLSDDAPEDALRELLELSKQFPDYAPIAAQIGLLQAGRGAYPQSLVYLERARRLDPSNLSYMYNYAIMLDNTERWEAAAEMYKELLYSVERTNAGHNIPIAEVKKRLDFLTSAEDQEAEFDEEQQIGMLSINRMGKSDN